MAVYNNPERCSDCSGKCCRYFMLQLDTPRSRDDFENIRWYLSHDKVTIYIEKKKWFLHMETVCRFLSESGRCENYENRPQICREHNPSDCEFDLIYTGDRKFETLAELDTYISRRFAKKKMTMKKIAEMERSRVEMPANFMERTAGNRDKI